MIIIEVLGVLVFFVFGYALAWGEGNAFIGWTNFALADVSEGELSNAFYQMVYANTVSGSIKIRFQSAITCDTFIKGFNNRDRYCGGTTQSSIILCLRFVHLVNDYKGLC